MLDRCCAEALDTLVLYTPSIIINTGYPVKTAEVRGFKTTVSQIIINLLEMNQKLRKIKESQPVQDVEQVFSTLVESVDVLKIPLKCSDANSCEHQKSIQPQLCVG